MQVENDIRYAGYVALDRERIERQRKHASRTIPEGFNNPACGTFAPRRGSSSRGSDRGRSGRPAA